MPSILPTVAGSSATENPTSLTVLESIDENVRRATGAGLAELVELVERVERTNVGTLREQLEKQTEAYEALSARLGARDDAREADVYELAGRLDLIEHDRKLAKASKDRLWKIGLVFVGTAVAAAANWLFSVLRSFVSSG